MLVLTCRMSALQAFHEMLSSKTKLVAMVHVSNMLGCILPAAQVAEAAHKVNFACTELPCSCTAVTTGAGVMVLGSRSASV